MTASLMKENSVMFETESMFTIAAWYLYTTKTELCCRDTLN